MAGRPVRALGLIAAVLLVPILLYMAIPGEHRLLCPACFGMRGIAGGIYVEPGTPLREERRTLSVFQRARQRVRSFYGSLQAKPIIVVCRTAGCVESFGGGTADAIAYGWQAVRFAPTGLNETIAAHELSHVELHKRIGFRGIFQAVVPVWFDEGLAVMVSGDKRLGRRVSRAARDTVVTHRTLRQWLGHTRAVGWRASYGAAAAVVRKIDRAVGRADFKRLVNRVAQGDNFDTVFAAHQRSP
ncbi:MAG: hypothetical protein ACR2PA_02225 [Hyphomicrobiaceae bacterium]